MLIMYNKFKAGQCQTKNSRLLKVYDENEKLSISMMLKLPKEFWILNKTYLPNFLDRGKIGMTVKNVVFIIDLSDKSKLINFIIFIFI